MTYRGTVRNGVVVFEGDAKPSEGIEVQVAEVSPAPSPATIWEKLLELAGSVPDLPPDAARNHDHYLYGTPKR